MKKKILYWGMLIIVVISFLLYFYSFTITDANNLYLTVDYENSNGWKITERQGDKDISLTPREAIESDNTVFLERTVTEDWAYYRTINIDSGRAVEVFIDNKLVFSNHQTDASVPRDLPLMKKPENLTFMVPFNFNSEWVGKTITLATRLYENEPWGSIGFELIDENVSLYQNEAWVNKQAFPGAMFGMLSLLLFGLFLFQFSTAKKGFSILFLAFASLLQMFCYMSLFHKNPWPTFDSNFAMSMYFLLPLLYLGTKIIHKKSRYFISILSVWSIYFALFIYIFVLHLPAPIWADRVDVLCFILIGIMVYYCIKEWKENPLLRHFLSILGVFFIGYVVLFFVSMALHLPLAGNIIVLFREATMLYCKPILFWIFTSILMVLFIIAVWELLQDRVNVAKQVERMENEQFMLNIQMEAAKGQLYNLRASQEQTVIYRHDMRHHLSLLTSFAVDGDLEKIKEYLQTTESDIDAVTPMRFCENETANLILAAFNAKAKKAGVSLVADVHLPNKVGINDTELCSLLSNGLENAITAVQNLQEEALRVVTLRISVENSKLLVLIKNPYLGNIEMNGQFPKSQKEEEGHGFGIKSMIAIADKYGGWHAMETTDGEFILKLVIPV